MSILRKAFQKYQKDGTKELLKSSIKYPIGRMIYAYYDSHCCPDDYDQFRESQDKHGNPHLTEHGVSGDKIITRDDLYDVAKKYGKVYQYDTGYKYSINSSEFTFNLPRDFTRKHNKYNIDPSYIYEIPDADIIGNRGICLYNGQFILNSARNDVIKLRSRLYSVDTQYLIRSLRPSIFDPHTTVDYAFPMANDRRNYAAWLLEFLPKLRGLEEYTKRTGIKPTILVNHNPPEYLIPSLNFFTSEEYNVLENKYGHIRANNLVLITHRRRNVIGKDEINPSGYKWVQKRAHNILSTERKTSVSRIYISRDDVPDRRPANNETEVVNRLETLGFQKVVPSYLPFEQQVRLFHDADIIVGIHGSGFYNQVFGTDHTIIEVVPPNKENNPGVYQIARILNNEYQFIPSPGNNEEGVDVDIEALCDEIKKYV